MQMLTLQILLSSVNFQRVSLLVVYIAQPILFYVFYIIYMETTRESYIAADHTLYFFHNLVQNLKVYINL